MEVRFLQLFFGFGEFGDEEIDGEGRIGKGKGRGAIYVYTDGSGVGDSSCMNHTNLFDRCIYIYVYTP